MSVSLNVQRIVISLIAFAACCEISFAQSKPTIVGSAESMTPGVRMDITELKRTEGGFLSLRFLLVNASTGSWTVHGTAEATYLLDNVNKKKYVSVRDSQGICVCSHEADIVPAGRTFGMWVRFAAPPEGVKKIAIVFPGFPPSESMPISQ